MSPLAAFLENLIGHSAKFARFAMLSARPGSGAGAVRLFAAPQDQDEECRGGQDAHVNGCIALGQLIKATGGNGPLDRRCLGALRCGGMSFSYDWAKPPRQEREDTSVLKGQSVSSRRPHLPGLVSAAVTISSEGTSILWLKELLQALGTAISTLPVRFLSCGLLLQPTQFCWQDNQESSLGPVMSAEDGGPIDVINGSQLHAGPLFGRKEQCREARPGPTLANLLGTNRGVGHISGIMSHVASS